MSDPQDEFEPDADQDGQVDPDPFDPPDWAKKTAEAIARGLDWLDRHP